jgi:carbamoyl-phosphate synthase large subunit
MNVQFALKGEDVYVLEVNPRASRTVPFVSKCIGRSLAKVAARCMAGTSLKEQGVTEEIVPNYYSVKEAVFPFAKFPGVDPILGPEMKSTGEVMGVGDTFAEAFKKAMYGAGEGLPKKGKVFLSVRDADKEHSTEVAKTLLDMGFALVATRGTARALKKAGLQVEVINKVAEGRPHIVDSIKNGEIAMIINTTEGKEAIIDSFAIRRNALQNKVSYTTTVAGAEATIMAMQFTEKETVRRLQDLHEGLK